MSIDNPQIGIPMRYTEDRNTPHTPTATHGASTWRMGTMTKIDAAVEAIKAAGFDQMAREFRKYPQHRERIAEIVSRDVSQRMGYAMGSKLEQALFAAAR